LLENGQTGTPEEFSQKLGMSRTSLYELLDELRAHGAKINYSKVAKTFYYKEPYEISITCIMRPLTYEESKSVSGGKFLFRILFFRTLINEFSVVTLPC